MEGDVPSPPVSWAGPACPFSIGNVPVTPEVAAERCGLEADTIRAHARTFAAADLSTSRSASVSRDGADLEVVTPKTVTVKIGA